MNCAKGDLAFIRTTHPRQDLHGLIVRCLEYWDDRIEGDCWMIELAGDPQLDDQGVLTQIGLIQDRHLQPIKGLDSMDTTYHETPVMT